MTKIEEPLEKGWLRHVMRDVQNEVAEWPHQSNFSRLVQSEHSGQDVPQPSGCCSGARDIACTSRNDF